MAGFELVVAALGSVLGALTYHEFKRRHEEHAARSAASADIARERQRSAELERLVALGGALGAALDMSALKQVFWRYLPAFARGRELWMLVRTEHGWDHLVRDVTRADWSVEGLEAVAAEALSAPAQADAQTDGVVVTDQVCFPMVVGEASLGVIGVRQSPPLSLAKRRALGAAVALVSVSIRNVQLLTETRENSLRDQLTGCFNRAYAVESLTTEMLRAKRNSRPVSVLMFDLDNLKDINDEFGHLAGDAVLSAVARQMLALLRASDVKCRWGGDEFLVVLPDTPLAGAAQAAATLTREVSLHPVLTASGRVTPTISVGVADASDGETDPMLLIARADEALYTAKHRGRNQLAVAS